jgi:Replication-relaxation
MRPVRDGDIRGSLSDSSSSSARLARPVRVSAERVFELARHLTERDREIAEALYEQQVLTTDQLALLFFSSRRRAQDRLLLLYRQRVVDRFYPPAPFGLGKSQAHWLLDEAGAILVAARLGVERKKLGWQRRDDWGSHPQLAHRLETNRFVTDLVAATLADPGLGVMWWAGPAEAARCFDLHRRLPSPRPDGGFELACVAGSIECYLEWDRATETKGRLRDKLRAYLRVCEVWGSSELPPINLLLVVPTAARLTALEDVVAKLRDDAKYRFFTGWGLYGATAEDLARQGPLGYVWWPLVERGPARAFSQLVSGGPAADPTVALGRRWRHDRPDFWPRLSPLGRTATAEPREVAEVVEEASDAAQPGGTDVAQRRSAATATDPAEMRHPTPDEGFLARRRAELDEELRADIATCAHRNATAGTDLRPSEIDGFMDDREPDEEGSWR